MRSIIVAALGFALVSCGSGSANWPNLAGKCASPRTGTDPTTGSAYADKKGTLNDEKMFLRAWTDDTYLWYSEVPPVDPAQYSRAPTLLDGSGATDYFAKLKTLAKTGSQHDKDRFHFWIPTTEWLSMSQSGVEVGYGITWVVLQGPKVPRQYVSGFVEPGSPADTKIPRGVQIVSVDGADFVNGNDVATINAGLFPATAGESHTLVVQDISSGVQSTVALVSAAVIENPTPTVKVINTGTGLVGYILFNDHIATAEGALIGAVNQLKSSAAGAQSSISDLVLDIRYNGGGYLAIASELAYMIAGQATSGKTFEQITFNNKHPDSDPIFHDPLRPNPFLSTAVGLSPSVPQGAPLPTLGLNRVFVLTGSGTCSASESILNSLAGVDVNVIQIGGTTCGKPYGFYPQENCGNTYFTIQFKGVNAKGFGDYADGFVPGGLGAGMLTGCQVADDFSKSLGDENERRLAAALNFRLIATCPNPSLIPALVFGTDSTSGLWGEGRVLKSAWRQNRILTP
jgi:C-terminal processing protease CtpA/Prc